jgi:hypothetical protein
MAHRRPDEAVFAAYGWDPAMSNEELSATLLKLNLERAKAEAGKPKAEGGRPKGEGRRGKAD